MVDKNSVLEAFSAVWDEADEEESGWGFPMKMALRSMAEKLGVTDEYYAMIRVKPNYIYD